MAYSFNDAAAANAHETQYLSRCSVTAASTTKGGRQSPSTARHGKPGRSRRVAFNDVVWELNDMLNDRGHRARDLSKEHPDLLHKLQPLWCEAVRYNVLPLDDRFAERGDSELAGRPELISGNRQIVFCGHDASPVFGDGEHGVTSAHADTAEIQVPKSGADGVIVAVGGITGAGVCTRRTASRSIAITFSACSRRNVEGAGSIPPGQHQVRIEFAYDGGDIAKGGKVSLFVDGKKTGEGHIEQTEPLAFGEESCDVGHEAGSPVTADYSQNGATEFSGQANWVEFDTGIAADDYNHLITPEERLQVAMAKQ